MEYSIDTRRLSEQPVLVARRSAPRSGVAAAIAEVLPRAVQLAIEHGIELAGPPFVRYIDASPEMMVFEPGVPIAAATSGLVDAIEQGAPAGLTLGSLPKGTAAATLHVGSYEALHEAYGAIERWMRDQGVAAREHPWESYLTDPSVSTNPDDWKTEIVWPCESPEAS